MKQNKEEIEAQIVAWLKIRTRIQWKVRASTTALEVRASTTALEAVEKKLAELLRQLPEHSQP